MGTLPLAHVVSSRTFLEHFAHIAFGLVVMIGVFAFYARERRKRVAPGHSRRCVGS